MTCVRFNKQIYQRKAIIKTIREFTHLADLKLCNENKYWRVCVTNIAGDFKNTILDEFANYALGCTKNSIR